MNGNDVKRMKIEDMDAVLAWMTDQGLDPKRIRSIDRIPAEANDRYRIVYFHLSEDGKRHVEAFCPGVALGRRDEPCTYTGEFVSSVPFPVKL